MYNKILIVDNFVRHFFKRCMTNPDVQSLVYRIVKVLKFNKVKVCLCTVLDLKMNDQFKSPSK